MAVGDPDKSYWLLLGNEGIGYHMQSLKGRTHMCIHIYVYVRKCMCVYIYI